MKAYRGTPALTELATQAICLSLLGVALLVVAGLWPESNWQTLLIAVGGWGCFAASYQRIYTMRVR